ncbi:MAG: alanine racemase [Candidatus Peregrinibacteria bacterium]
MVTTELTWVEISREALRKNIRQFREVIGADRILCPCVKANAYGHGLIECAKTFLDAGADWLAVNAVYEARALREAGIFSPIYVLGYVPFDELAEAIALDLRMVVYNKETISRLAEAAGEGGKRTKVHLKIETGNNRQGVAIDDLVEMAEYIRSFDRIELEGLSTHFANIEDTTDHGYAEIQLARFNKAVSILEKSGIKVPIKHCGNSAATLIFPETHFDMVRPGISCYGMWPSKETHLSYTKEVGGSAQFSPAFTWKAKVAQVKTVPAGECIGYGCTYKTTRQTRVAIIPVGYYDGYDRGVSGRAHVLIQGKRAPLCGRVCMNIIMADVTDIPNASLEDEVVLIGRDGDENISAELFAQWADTINYEIPTRVNERIPRMYI